eukprot:6214638-Pleurochrysis_carterae.AAC.7
MCEYVCACASERERESAHVLRERVRVWVRESKCESVSVLTMVSIEPKPPHATAMGSPLQNIKINAPKEFSECGDTRLCMHEYHLNAFFLRWCHARARARSQAWSHGCAREPWWARALVCTQENETAGLAVVEAVDLYANIRKEKPRLSGWSHSNHPRLPASEDGLVQQDACNACDGHIAFLDDVNDAARNRYLAADLPRRFVLNIVGLRAKCTEQ